MFLTGGVCTYKHTFSALPALVGGVLSAFCLECLQLVPWFSGKNKACPAPVWETVERVSEMMPNGCVSFVCLVLFLRSTGSCVVTTFMWQDRSSFPSSHCVTGQSTGQPLWSPGYLKDAHCEHGWSTQGNRVILCSKVFLGMCPGCWGPTGALGFYHSTERQACPLKKEPSMEGTKLNHITA